MNRSLICLAILSLGVVVSAATPQDAKAKGEKIFAEQKCTLCHSIAGKGNAKGPLDEVGSKLTDGEIRNWITDSKAMTEKTKATRKPAMKAYTLSKEDVDALGVYLSALKTKK
jgi:mono/diheme cytochrome c family protein